VIESEDFFTYNYGKKNSQDTKPYAMSYAGHQFGNWGQLVMEEQLF
jgi:uncharacterized protein YdiU (UPF0061 family)